MFEVFFPEGYGLFEWFQLGCGGEVEGRESTLSVSQSFLMQSTSSTVTESVRQSLVRGFSEGEAYIGCRDLKAVSLCRSAGAAQSTHS